MSQPDQFHKHCLVCRSTKLHTLSKYQHAFLNQCINCRFIFALKIPGEQDLTLHYTNYPRYDILSPITIKRYHQLLNEFEKYRQTNNILDIGCSNGYFLETAKQRGWNVYGQEYADECIEICKNKGINIKQGYLENINFENNFFDIITSFEVIEHINTPVTHTQTIYRILRNGGLFYFTTPNFNSISRNILGYKWNIIEYPEHLSYFTPQTIKHLLIQSNFKKLKIKTTGISLSRIKQSKSSYSHSSCLSNNPDEMYRQKAEKNLFFKILKDSVNFILNLFKKGDTIKGYFVK
jgi:2-polyprenyl-3-methyl-5-hydroxy-6-metoxy-1,4-benzoquinol methylase